MSAAPSKLHQRRLITHPSLLAFGLLFLLIVIAMLLITDWLRQEPLIRPVSPVVSVVHIAGNAAERHQVGVFAFRDNTVWKNDEIVGLLSVSVGCRVSARREPLPDELSIKRVLSVVGTDGFQSIGNAETNKFNLWLVRVEDGRRYKCFSLSDDDAVKNAEFAPLIRWFQAVEATREPLRAIDCRGDPDSVYQWCK